MYYLDLFSGIGGFALGAYWAGWRFDEHYFSEIDDYCVKLYKTRFPAAIPLGNIAKINVSDLPQAEWFITGGFPCQDISIAGKGEGIEGARSSLWFEMWRIIRILRPRFAIIENVGAITHRGLDTVLGNLAEIGYDAEWQDIRASDVGAPHKRERIWIVAYPSIERERGLHIRQGGSQQPSGKPKRSGQDVANTEETDRWGASREEDTGRGYPEAGRCGESRSRAQHWLPESGIRRLAHGIPHRVDRLKALGNSIVPQIAELLFRRIREIMKSELT